MYRNVLTLFNDVVGAYHDRRRDGEVQGLGRLEIDDKLEPGRLFDWDVSRLCILRIRSTISAPHCAPWSVP